jgi:hypothetical protein
MSRFASGILLALAALAGVAATAEAQGAPTARAERTLGGLWIASEYGGGFATIDCPGCPPGQDSHPWEGGAGFATGFAMGGTPAPALELGGEFGYFRTLQRDGRSAVLSIVAATARFHPAAVAPLSVRAGAGLGTLDLAGAVPLGARTTERGLALRGGVAYDIRVARAYAVVPTAGVTWVLTGRNDAQLARTPGYLHLAVGLVRY